MRAVAIIIFLLFLSFASATTFVHLTLDELDKTADYVIIGSVAGQNSVAEGKVITTETTIRVEEWLKGFSWTREVVVKELGGAAGDVMMVVPGSPQFEQGERVALFIQKEPVKEQAAGRRAARASAMSNAKAIRGKTVGMAQGKFRIIKNTEGKEMLLSELHGAHLLTDYPTELLPLAMVREKYFSWWQAFRNFLFQVAG